MRRFLRAALVWLALAGGAQAAITLDGTASAILSPGTPLTANLTTTQTNTVIYLAFRQFGGPGTISVSDVAGLTWTLRSGGGIAINGQYVLYYAKSTGILTADTITVTTTTGSDFQSFVASAWAGVNFTTPFDANGVLPVVSGPPGTACTASTSSAPDMLIYNAYYNALALTNAGNLTTAVTNTYILQMYKALATTQSAQSFTGTTLAAYFICDALVAATPPASTSFFHAPLR